MSRKYLFLQAASVLGILLALGGCGGGGGGDDGDGASPPPNEAPGGQLPATDAFVSRVLAVLGMPETAEPVDVSSITATTPEDAEPVPLP